MGHTVRGLTTHELEQCRYDGSRLLLRGPRRNLDNAFVACLGGTETFARFIPEPYPDLLEAKLGVTCVNFGWPNAGIDVFRNDPALIDCASRSQVCVLQVPNAINMSNSFYRVHPRRNDRVLEATETMRALFPKVDFTRFSFTRHMLTRLRAVDSDAFVYLQKELTSVWVAGMQELVTRIEAPVVLLWMSMRRIEEATDRPDLTADPALVSPSMMNALKPATEGMIEVLIKPEARGLDAEEIAVPSSTAEAILTADAHIETANALGPVLGKLLKT